MLRLTFAEPSSPSPSAAVISDDYSSIVITFPRQTDQGLFSSLLDPSVLFTPEFVPMLGQGAPQ